MSNNLGSVFVFMLITALALLTWVILRPFSCGLAIRIRDKIKQKLMWNFVIRLVIETFLELSFSCYFNLRYANCDFAYVGSWVNYFFAVLFTAMLVAAPFFIIGFYLKYFDSFTDEEFEEKFGSVYEGLRTDRKNVIFYTAYFVVRRGAYAMISIGLYNYVILQLSLSQVITLVAACYILHFQPFDEPLINNLEVMTETFTLLLICVIYCFTALFDDAEFQYNVGFVFIVVMCLCIVGHLVFMIRDLVADLILNIKRWRNNQKISLKVNQRMGGRNNKGCGALIRRICWIRKEKEQEEE